jgi:hypothetical protein
LENLEQLQRQRLEILDHLDPKVLEQEQLGQRQACREKKVASSRSVEQKSTAFQQLQQCLSISRHDFGNQQVCLTSLEQRPRTKQAEEKLQAHLEQLRL